MITSLPKEQFKSSIAPPNNLQYLLIPRKDIRDVAVEGLCKLQKLCFYYCHLQYHWFCQRETKFINIFPWLSVLGFVCILVYSLFKNNRSTRRLWLVPMQALSCHSRLIDGVVGTLCVSTARIWIHVIVHGIMMSRPGETCSSSVAQGPGYHEVSSSAIDFPGFNPCLDCHW